MGRLTGRWVVAEPSPLARSMAEEGACVLVAGSSPAEVAEVVAAIRAAGGRADAWAGAVTDPGAAEMAAELYPTCTRA